MNKGKRKCERLKIIRKYIAKANGIEYEPTECHHEGECLGTCPKCDAELAELQRQLDEKEKRGEKVIYENEIPPEDIAEDDLRIILEYPDDEHNREGCIVPRDKDYSGRRYKNEEQTTGIISDDDSHENDITNIVYGLIAIALGVLCILIFSSHLIFWVIIFGGIYLIVRWVKTWIRE